MARMTAKQVKKKLQLLKSARGTWEEHWQDIADFIFTRKNDITTTRTPGEKRAFRLLDNVGMYSNEMLAGALHGMLTNPDLFFFEFTTGDYELDNDDEVRRWLEDSMRVVHRILNNTNFQTEVHELYLDLVSFGTACMYIVEDKEDVVRFRTKFIRDYFISESHLGRVDEIYHEYKASAKNIVEEFGLENCPPEVTKAFKKDSDQMFCCVHTVYPYSMRYPKYQGPPKFISQYFVMEEDFEISHGTFNEFPYVVPRWTKAAGELYGRSPGMNALPEMKVLNKMNETMLIGAQKVVDPPIQMPDDGFIMPIITTPGGINYYRSGSQEIIKPVFADTKLEWGYQQMEDRRKRVRDAFFIDHLRLQQGGPMMTATEVMQRTEEAMRLLGPMLGRQQVEFLRPLIDRVFNIAERRRMIPLPPVSIQGKRIDVRYSSLIAKSHRVNEANNIMRAVSASAPFIQLDPQAAMNFDADEAVRIVHNVYGAPQRILRTKKQVEDARTAAAQQQAQVQQQVQQSQGAVDALNTAKAAKEVSGL